MQTDRLAPNAALMYSLYSLRPEAPATCRIRRVDGGVEQDFSGTDVMAGVVSAWLGSSAGRVTTLYDQSGNGLHATAARGAFYAEHSERGPCLHFPGEAEQVYAVADSDLYKTSDLTLYQYSQFLPSSAATPTLAGYPSPATDEVPPYRWRLCEHTADGRIRTDCGGGVTLSDKPNGWWRTPMVYASRLGTTVAHWIGNYAFDQHEGTPISYPMPVGLRIGGGGGHADDLFTGTLFDLLLVPADDDGDARMATVDALCRRRLRPFPFQERMTHVGPAFAHPAAEGLDGTNHPVLVKEAGMYYLFWNTAITGEKRGIQVATSPDMCRWTQRGRVLAPGPAGAFDSKIPFAPRLKRIHGVWVMWYAAQREPDGNASIGVASNAGDLTVAADWVQHGQILDRKFAGKTITVDPVVYYDPVGYDAGKGDGTHPIWLLYGSGASNSAIYHLYLAYADCYAGPYRPANGGNPVSSVDGKGYPYLWPGDIWRDPHSGIFWKLQSYGVDVRAGYANGNGRAGWTYADSLAGPWHWVPRHLEYLAPARTGDQRAIEVSFYEEGADLHVLSANDSDDVGYRDSIQHWKTAVASPCRAP